MTFSMTPSSDSENLKTGRSDSKTKPPTRCVTQEGVTVTDAEALIFRSEPINTLMSDLTNVMQLQASTLHKGQQDDRSSTNSVCVSPTSMPPPDGSTLTREDPWRWQWPSLLLDDPM
jgi:hypothetical protein